MTSNDDDFPWKEYDDEELLVDFEKLRTKLDKDKPTLRPEKRSLIGYKSSNAFFQEERMNIRSQGKQSCFDFWRKKKTLVKKHAKKHGKKDLFNATVFLNVCPAQFPPYMAGMIYKYFEATKVFDPYAGWGDRCVAAMAMNIDYVGCDSNLDLEKPYKSMLDFYDFDSDIEIFFGKSEELFPRSPPKGTDLLFTSPPFFSARSGSNTQKLVEEYKGSESDYETFMETSLIPVMKTCIKKNIWTCVYVPENMYEYLKEVFGKARKKFYLPTRHATHVQKDSKSNIVYCW